jgi:hypothetical protein
MESGADQFENRNCLVSLVIEPVHISFIRSTRLALFRFCIVVTNHCDLLMITSLGTIRRLNNACINVSINSAAQGAPTHNQKVLMCQQSTNARSFHQNPTQHETKTQERRPEIS